MLTVLASVAGLVGCGPESEPAAPLPVPPEYEPAEQAVQLTADRYLDFKVIDRTDPDYSVSWLRGGVEIAQGPRYRYFPARYGIDTLTAAVAYDERSYVRRWLVDVIRPAAQVEFTPAADSLTVLQGLSRTLSASSNRPGLARHRWLRDGIEAGTDTSYVFHGDTPGYGTVRCEVVIGDELLAHGWSIRTLSFAESEPPPVEGFRVSLGTQPGEVYLHWQAIADWVFDILEYRILASTEGPITARTRDEATELLRVPSVAGRHLYYQDLIAPDYEALRDRDWAWFSVVGVDTGGRIGQVMESLPVRLPYVWYVAGTIRGALGRPVADARVTDSAGTLSVRTDAQGAYRIGPYPSVRSVILLADKEPADGEPGYHSYVSRLLTGEDFEPLDIALIPAFGADPDCVTYLGDFQRYVRYMTSTKEPRSDRPNVSLYRWEEFPLRVFVPDFTSPAGVDFGAAARSAIAIWNLLLGETYLVLVDDPQDAQIQYELGESSATQFGVTELLQPGDGSIRLGAAVPEVVGISLFDTISTVRKAETTALHEMGHALGILAHASCNDVGYLMYYNVSVSYEDWPAHSIHPDELNLIRTIRFLPQGQDMSVYPID